MLVDGVPAGGRATARTIDSTIDVRGQRVDEAVANVDRFLDESLMAAPRHRVRRPRSRHRRAAHGDPHAPHGHKAIDKFRAGEPNEGGDGVTVAFLKG